MSICQEHWTKLREAIESRGLGHLIAADGALAAQQTADQFERAARGEESMTAANYDPLMAAYWAILNNAGQIASRASGSGSALYVMTDGPEDPIEGFPGQEGKTWPRCAVCYLSLAHELTCRDRKCKLPKKGGYDWMIGKAADEEVKHAVKLGVHRT